MSPRGASCDFEATCPEAEARSRLQASTTATHCLSVIGLEARHARGGVRERGVAGLESLLLLPCDTSALNRSAVGEQ